MCASCCRVDRGRRAVDQNLRVRSGEENKTQRGPAGAIPGADRKELILLLKLPEKRKGCREMEFVHNPDSPSILSFFFFVIVKFHHNILRIVSEFFSEEIEAAAVFGVMLYLKL